MLTTYGSANQDVNVILRQGTTYTADRCTGGTASASGVIPAHGAALAFDNNSSTYWQVNALPAWLEYNFGVNRTIRRYILYSSTTTSGLPSSWTFEYYNGSTWQTADTRSAITWSSQQAQTFDVAADFTSSRWRISITAVQQPSTSAIVPEMEMMELNATTKDRLAQSFQIGSASPVSRVRLWLNKVGAPTGNLTLSIQTNGNGGSQPSGTAVTNGTSTPVAISTLGTSYGWVDFTFSTPPNLSAGTTYWLVLDASAAGTSTNYVQWGADGSSPGYANGQMMSQTGGNWSVENKDAVFEVRSS